MVTTGRFDSRIAGGRGEDAFRSVAGVSTRVSATVQLLKKLPRISAPAAIPAPATGLALAQGLFQLKIDIFTNRLLISLLATSLLRISVLEVSISKTSVFKTSVFETFFHCFVVLFSTPLW